MSTKSMLHQAMFNEWATHFANHKSSGLSVAQWCKENNLSVRGKMNLPSHGKEFLHPTVSTF